MTSVLILCCVLPQDLKQDVEKLREKVQDQEERLQDLERENAELKKRQAQTVGANPLTVLNPTLTVVGNTLWRLDDDHVVTEEGDAIDDTVNVREVELDMRAAIDPYADGVAIVTFESEAPGEFEVGVEELLVKIKSLPVPLWEMPPLGTQITVGRMRTAFGTNNVMHLHDLPQSNRPLVVEEFLGEEGHIASGASARMFLPSPDETALQLTVQALQGGGIEVAQDRDHPAYLANLHFFAQLADEHALDASLIGFYGTNDEDGHRQSRVVSFDVWYRWKPLRQGEFRSFLLGGQVFAATHEFEADLDDDGIVDTSDRTRPFGTTAWAQYQLSARAYAGVRWDQTDFLADDARDRRKVQPYVSWYMSEFFRVRASYEHTWSDDQEEDGLNTVLVELNVVFGAHPSEPFWVNK